MTGLDSVQDGVPVMQSKEMGAPGGTAQFRLFGWTVLAVMAGFILNNYLTYWIGLPGIGVIFGGPANGDLPVSWSWLQMALYALLVLVAFAYVLRSPAVTLRSDSGRINRINAYLIRGVFFAVVLVGLVDSVISFLRVEDLLPSVVGADWANDLGKSSLRGAYVHMPLIALGFVIAAFTRTLGFYWLALLVVFAEVLIVIGRFIFSYEQAFLADLVRFWYAGLFLFASAYTLLEEGHVRVDILYAGLSRRTQGFVNAFGSIFLGVALCWVVLIIGMGGKQNIINSPMLTYETTQASFGLFVKYLMAGYLGVFAVTMMIQFISYFMDAVADIRGEPGGRDHDSHSVQ